MTATAAKIKRRATKSHAEAPPATPPFRSHESATIASFRRDPGYAAAYLNTVLADGDQEELLVALRYMAQAFGGVPTVADKARLNATTLYRTLSPRGNPELKSLTALLNAMGMRLAVQTIPRARAEDARDARDLVLAARHIAKCREETFPAELVDRLLSGESPIRVWREFRGLTAAALAERLGVTPAHVSKLENGKGEPSVSLLRRLARVLAVDVEALRGPAAD
jgi:probable addiction module antidote protein